MPGKPQMGRLPQPALQERARAQEADQALRVDEAKIARVEERLAFRDLCALLEDAVDGGVVQR